MALSEIADVLKCLATRGNKGAVQNSGRESDDVVAIAVQFECDALVLRGATCA